MIRVEGRVVGRVAGKRFVFWPNQLVGFARSQLTLRFGPLIVLFPVGSEGEVCLVKGALLR